MKNVILILSLLIALPQLLIGSVYVTNDNPGILKTVSVNIHIVINNQITSCFVQDFDVAYGETLDLPSSAPYVYYLIAITTTPTSPDTWPDYDWIVPPWWDMNALEGTSNMMYDPVVAIDSFAPFIIPASIALKDLAIVLIGGSAAAAIATYPDDMQLPGELDITVPSLDQYAIILGTYIVAQVAKRRKQLGQPYSNVIYTKRPENPVPGSGFVYTGRTHGWGTPTQVMNRRKSGHNMNALFPVTELSSYIYSVEFDPAAYIAVRGREQQTIDHYDSQGRKANAIRGVWAWNRLGPIFHASSDLQFGPLHAYTGFYVGTPFVPVPLTKPVIGPPVALPLP